MEYHLLILNNQETDSVRYELYCALEALNRMDYYAEPYLTQALANGTNPQTFSAAYDGFMLRDDVPIDFIQNNISHFNYYRNKGFCSKVKINTVSTSSGNGAIMQGQFYKPPEYYPNGVLKKPGRYEANYAGSYISQDNWINCLVGLALVRKFVTSGVNYKNLSFSDGNGPNMNQEAFSIALRVMNFFKADANWALKYPTGTFIGSHWGGIGAGLAFAHAEALNKIDQNKWGHFVFPPGLSFNNWCEYNDWRHDGSVLVQFYKNVIIIPLMYNNYLLTSHASGTLGNIYTQNPLFIFPNAETVFKLGQLYPLSNNNDVAVQVSNISAVGNCEYTFRGVDTKSRLQLHINAFEIWHAELLRVALHGEGICHTTDLNQSYFNAAVNLINSAPCYGPARWEESGVTSTHIEWDTQTRLDHPEARNGGGWPGEYNGIDYMFYHNLINIIDIEKNGINDSKKLVDFGQRHITTSYPTSINGQNWGTNNKPATVKSFEYIVADNSVNTNANVTYLAGKEITLGNGFSAINTNSFTAAIQQFACSEIMSNPLNPSVNAKISNTTTTGSSSSKEAIYPDMMATSYETAVIPASDNSVSSSSTYSPSLIHVDSLYAYQANLMGNGVVVEIAPNPTTGFSKLFISKPELIKSIDVIEPLGKLVFTLSTVSYSNEIDLTHLSKGIYSVILRNIDGELITKKIVVQ